jgi:cytochrome c oxidase assembly protein subunit 15
MGGLWAGLLSGMLNLMVLGSLLGAGRGSEVVHQAVWWVPAGLAFSAALAAIGAAVGKRLQGTGYPEQVNWTGVFSKVAVGTVLLLVLVGGMVTSEEAGLAVVDWPQSFGTFMFLLPLSRMTGGAYYEHSHRLIGSLLGLTTLVLAVHLWWTDPRPRVRWLIAGALLAVIVQGVLGGLRVTGYFTLTTDPTQVSPKTWLAIVHGVFGQVVFGLLTAVAVLTSTAWHNSVIAEDSPRRRTDAVLTEVLVGLLVVQLTLGALVRHLITPPMAMHEAAARLALVHIALAVVVVGWAVLAGARAWGLYGERFAMLRQFGLGMVWLAGLQVLLGFLSLVVTWVFVGVRAWPDPTRMEVIITTLHQTVGAVMLAWAVALALWVRREESQQLGNG